MTHFTAETWIAIGTLTTAAVALAAGVAAFWQVREMRRTREHESRPYPVVFMELNDSNRHVVELVVKNFGRTCAYDVDIEFDPPLVRTAGSGRSEPVGTFDRLPVLVPDQPWRTFWDQTFDYVESGLPDHFTAVVSFRDERRRSRAEYLTLTYNLDWSIFADTRFFRPDTIADGAKALKKISETLEKAQESDSDGLNVWVRDGVARDEEDRQRREEWAEEYARQQQADKGTSA